MASGALELNNLAVSLMATSNSGDIERAQLYLTKGLDHLSTGCQCHDNHSGDAKYSDACSGQVTVALHVYSSQPHTDTTTCATFASRGTDRCSPHNTFRFFDAMVCVSTSATSQSSRRRNGRNDDTNYFENSISRDILGNGIRSSTVDDRQHNNSYVASGIRRESLACSLTFVLLYNVGLCHHRMAMKYSHRRRRNFQIAAEFYSRSLFQYYKSTSHSATTPTADTACTHVVLLCALLNNYGYVCSHFCLHQQAVEHQSVLRHVFCNSSHTLHPDHARFFQLAVCFPGLNETSPAA